MDNIEVEAINFEKEIQEFNKSTFLHKKKKKRKTKIKSVENDEGLLQEEIVRYLRTKYPNVIFSAGSEGIKLTIGQAIKAKRQGVINKALPDLIILEPQYSFCGLCIEIKREDVKIFKKDKTLYKNPHHESQHKLLQRLKKKGYQATFGIGEKHIKTIIDSYLKFDFTKLSDNLII